MCRVAELRGGDRPDPPPDQPGKPDRSADHPRLPKPEPGTNRDPETIRRVMRAAENPAFADPRYEPRGRAASPTNTGIRVDPSKPIFTENPEPLSTPKIKVNEPRRLGELKAETLEVETPKDSPPIDKDDAGMPDPPGESAFDRLNRRFVKDFGDASEWSGAAFTKVQTAIDPVRPTGQHVEHHPDDLGTDGPPAHSGVDGGMAGAAMLATGLLIGHVARLAYRKTAELKEDWDARNR